MNHITRTQDRSAKAIARHLTGCEIEDMKNAYRRGAGIITTRRGKTLTRAAFENVASYLKVAL